jgi:hypothetical protein
LRLLVRLGFERRRRFTAHPFFPGCAVVESGSRVLGILPRSGTMLSNS